MPSDSKEYPYSGSCLCGKVQYKVEKFMPHMAHCHCNMCQKFHGAAFSTFGEVKLEHLHWLSGEKDLKSYRASNDSIRYFCRHCGSSMLFSSKYNRAEGSIELAIATLDNAAELTPDAHIFTNSKVPWLKLTDNLPQYPKYRNE